MLTLGQLLKELRIARHQTQTQVAQAIGVTQSVISDIEEGRDGPNLEMLRVLTSYYGITLAEFFTRLGQ